MTLPAERIRYCRTCPEDRPTILSEYNNSEQCYACQEKILREAPPKPAHGCLESHRRLGEKRLRLATLPKNVCHNCGRSGKVVTLFEKKRSGEVYCHTCRKSLRDPAALAECRRKLKGKGRLAPGRAGKV